MKVQVYFNLHKRLFSVRDATTRKVITHTESISLYNVRFKVSAAGRRRVLREGRKNVHAYAEGFVSSVEYGASICARRVTYNPYCHSTFIECHGGEEIHGASRAMLRIEPGMNGDKAAIYTN